VQNGSKENVAQGKLEETGVVKGPHVNTSGWLDVGDGHEIYWEDWGNPKAETPVVHLHGGPGGGFSDSNKALYDPAVQRVIFHDQRGAGRSRFQERLERNTTQDLVADIERLLEYLEVRGQVYVAGGSWGSTLALCYTIAYPERVKRLLLRSVFLARQFDTDWVNEGGPKFALPEEWQRLVAVVPEGKRGSGDEIMRYYAEKIRSKDAVEARRYALAWNLWEGALVSVNYDPRALEVAMTADSSMMAVALIETHYFLSGCFVPENYILDNVSKIKHIPCDVVHGRFDLCTPASAAWDLARAYGEKLVLRWVNAGHVSGDPLMWQELRELVRERLV
jgi:proline iminopeptidase